MRGVPTVFLHAAAGHCQSRSVRRGPKAEASRGRWCPTDAHRGRAIAIGLQKVSYPLSRTATLAGGLVGKEAVLSAGR